MVIRKKEVIFKATVYSKCKYVSKCIGLAKNKQAEVASVDTQHLFSILCYSIPHGANMQKLHYMHSGNKVKLLGISNFQN